MAIKENHAASTTARKNRKRKQASIKLAKVPSDGTQNLSALSAEEAFKLLDARFRSLDDPEARKRFLRQLLDQVKGLSMCDLLIPLPRLVIVEPSSPQELGEDRL